jgi:hypothetical protein
MLHILKLFRIADLSPIERGFSLFDFYALRIDFFLSPAQGLALQLKLRGSLVSALLRQAQSLILSEQDLDFSEPGFEAVKLAVDLLEAEELE